jgi:HTH-type transcriptional regulator / antitoxin HigA
MVKIIENELEYNVVLEEIEQLMDNDPEPDSIDGKKLQLLTTFVKNYEIDLEIMELPDPITAIEFRMEQQELKQRDLIPYIGSRSKVSEVLSRKRPLSIEMIRALNNGLGIPAELLVQEPTYLIKRDELELDKFPVKEIVKRNWLEKPVAFSKNKADEILNSFMNQMNKVPQFHSLNRANNNFRSGKRMDMHALYLWKLRILQKAKKEKVGSDFIRTSLTKDYLNNLVKLSVKPDGPIQAIDALRRIGIIVIIEPHLPRTYLDGATIFVDNDNPVIGISIRFDRIDNFWFTLMHEIAHVYLHYNSGYESFFDDLEVRDENDHIENEADEFARDTLIPKEDWYNSPASKIKFPQAAEDLARELNIHPAIVAGRMRYEFNAYRLLNNLIGSNQIRKLFTDLVWS